MPTSVRNCYKMDLLCSNFPFMYGIVLVGRMPMYISAG